MLFEIPTLEEIPKAVAESDQPRSESKPWGADTGK